jgi:pyrroline-5-carboxylate reductase
MGKRIAIIGGGNLGTAIAEGLLESKFSKASEIIVTRRNTAVLKPLQEKGIAVSDNNAAAVAKSDVVILAIKPFQVSEVMNSIKKEVGAGKLLISVVTGVTISEMESIIK